MLDDFPKNARVSRRRAAGMLTALLLAGCRTPPSEVVPQLTFAGARPLALDVGDLLVQDQTANAAPGGAGEVVEGELDEPVAALVGRWARQRFYAVGYSGTARLIIEQAQLRRELLARSQGLRAIVTIDQSERYSVAIAVRMALSDPPSARDGFAWASAESSVTIAENATLTQRQQKIHAMLEQAINALDQSLTSQMREKVSSFVVR